MSTDSINEMQAAHSMGQLDAYVAEKVGPSGLKVGKIIPGSNKKGLVCYACVRRIERIETKKKQQLRHFIKLGLRSWAGHC